MGTTNTYTISLWFKRSGLGTTQRLFTPFEATENDQDGIYIDSSDQLNLKKSGSGGVATSSGVFRDTSGWYHLCFQNDAGAAEYWINGVSQGTTTGFPASAAGAGRFGNKVGGSEYFDGLMSYIIYSDGTAYAPTVFGSTDSDTGEWVINTAPTVTYGSQGFFILKNGNSVTDQSGEGNDATISGAGLTQTEDCPDDVFCTINPLDNYGASSTFTNGNNTVAIGTNDRTNTSTLGMYKGKFYFEVKYTPGSQIYSMIGISNYAVGSVNATTSGYLTHTAVGNWGYSIQGGGASTSNYARKSENNVAANTSPYPAAGYASNQLVADDIVQVAIDLDNNAIWWGKNGLGYWGTDGYNGDPAANTYGFAIADPSTIVGGTYYVACGRSDAGGVTWTFNFGNGYFGTTAITSAGTNASGIGLFEYDVPTGFTAISTKGLNS